jgi:hypothetical protein
VEGPDRTHRSWKPVIEMLPHVNQQLLQQNAGVALDTKKFHNIELGYDSLLG